MQLKVTKVGDSMGVILPKEFIEKCQINEGDLLEIMETPDGFVVKLDDAELKQQIEVAEEVMREDYYLLKRLAK